MTQDMTRHQGGTDIAVAECIDRHYNTWRVRTDIQPVYDEQDAEHQTGVSFIETEFPYKPSMDDVKDFVKTVIDAETDAKILDGFVWTVLHGDDAGETVNVWLSMENQNNYSEAQRLANMMPDQVLPVTFKLGQKDDGTAVYDTFETVQEINMFYVQVFAYVKQCLDEGWQKKDGFDWTPYELALNPVTEEAETSE